MLDPSRIIPVMDLMGSIVVHAVAGRRHEYQPIRSQLTIDPTPTGVARAFVECCGFREVYVADLDAIGGDELDCDSYQGIADAGLRLILDAGVATADRALQLAEWGGRTGQVAGVVVGSESVLDSKNLDAAWRFFDPRQAIFSLDLRAGRPIVANPVWSGATPLEIVAEVVRAGYQRLIVLDLAAVGTGAGPATLELCRQIRQENSITQLISGGGIRNRKDVQALCEAGCDQVLVASALHDGRLLHSRPS